MSQVPQSVTCQINAVMRFRDNFNYSYFNVSAGLISAAFAEW